jgi:MFS family permease
VNTKTALRFVLMIGIVSFFADFVYEGARSITGPYLAVLGASAGIVGLVSGAGEFLGYGLRLVSGGLSERTGKFWPITLFGYAIQMAAVPLLSLAPTWPVAALLIVTERIGKATRNPPRDVMLSHAAKEMGYGWGFGIHEALDQSGALVGPLVVALLLSKYRDYRFAFAALLIPAILTLALIVTARFVYPHPERLETPVANTEGRSLPRTFWIYFAGAALVSAGFVDFSIAAFHFQKTGVVARPWIPIFYAVAMGVSGLGSLGFGRLFDRYGLKVLLPLTLIGIFSSPLIFLGGFRAALAGAALWGLGMGVHESIIPAAVATIVPAERRPSAYGIFTAGYGIAWFLGSAAMGFLYDVSIPAIVAFSVAAELLALPFFLKAARPALP